jgi:hypothetical protein
VHLRLILSPPCWQLAVARPTRGAFPVAAGHGPKNLIRTRKPIRQLQGGDRPRSMGNSAPTLPQSTLASRITAVGSAMAGGIVLIQNTLRPSSSYTPPVPAAMATFSLPGSTRNLSTPDRTSPAYRIGTSDPSRLFGRGSAPKGKGSCRRGVDVGVIWKGEASRPTIKVPDPEDTVLERPFGVDLRDGRTNASGVAQGVLHYARLRMSRRRGDQIDVTPSAWRHLVQCPGRTSRDPPRGAAANRWSSPYRMSPLTS